MCGSTLILGLSIFIRRNVGKISFFLPPFSLFYSVSSPSLLFASPYFLFFFLSISPFLIHRTSFLLFAPISFSHFSFFSYFSHFLSSFIFSFHFFLFDPHPPSFPFFFFFPFFHFLLYFFLFLFSFLFLIWIASTEWSKSWGNFPPLSSIAICHHHHFSLNFLILLFPLFPSFDTWLNVSHSHKCTT